LADHTPTPEESRRQMMVINERQKGYYEGKSHVRDNVVMQAWKWGRHSMQNLRREMEVTALIHERHRQWLGELHGKRILDLGCSAGNALSVEIASKCGNYVGIDLDEPAIQRLREKLAAQNLPHARAEAIDFLAPDFPFGPFDVIYAHSVMHHFKHFDTFLQVLRERLVPGGKVITIDPLQTAWTVWLPRLMYRPFQRHVNADWEWPFTRQSLEQIEHYFHIEAMQGCMGHAKWAIPLAMLPRARQFALRVGRRLHSLDVRAATCKGSALWRCMGIALCLQRKG
jgi:2-polyprenyl-3-methyl-5-hydroxy-6-metoxy-1,4-benzoquinol methylase